MVCIHLQPFSHKMRLSTVSFHRNVRFHAFGWKIQRSSPHDKTKKLLHSVNSPHVTEQIVLVGEPAATDRACKVLLQVVLRCHVCSEVAKKLHLLIAKRTTKGGFLCLERCRPGRPNCSHERFARGLLPWHGTKECRWRDFILVLIPAAGSL